MRRVALCVMFILTVTAMGVVFVRTSGYSSLRRGLLYYFKFDGNFVDKVSGKTAIITGSVPFVEGKFGQAMASDGSNYISPPAGKYSDYENLTVSMWCMFALSGNSNIMNFPGSNPYFAVFPELWLRYADTNTYVRSTVTPAANTWHHIVIIFDNGYVRVYLNTSKIIDYKTNKTYGAVINENMQFQHTGAQVTRFDEVAIWSRALSVEEIAKLYNAGNGRVIF
jgi:hypothetical protein